MSTNIEIPSGLDGDVVATGVYQSKSEYVREKLQRDGIGSHGDWNE